MMTAAGKAESFEVKGLVCDGASVGTHAVWPRGGASSFSSVLVQTTSQEGRCQMWEQGRKEGGTSGSRTSSSSQFRGSCLVPSLEGRTEAGVTPSTQVGKMNELHTPAQRKEA